MWRTLFLATVLLLAPAAASANSWHHSAGGYEAAQTEQEKSGAPMLVYVKTDWCHFCKALDAEVLSRPKVKDYLKPFVKVTLNPEEGRSEAAIAQKLGVTGFPSVFVVVNGKKPVRIDASGEEGPDAFIAKVRKIAGDPEPAPDKPVVATADSKTASGVSHPLLMDGVPSEILELMDQGRADDAISHLSKQLAASPNANLYYARALCYRSLHKHDSAVADDLNHYLDKHPDDIEARELLARSYLNLTMNSDAAEELEKVVKSKPTGDSYFLLAEAEKKLGKADAAMAHYAAACKLGNKTACKP